MNTSQNRRILLVDDMPAIHEDFRKILAPQPPDGARLSAVEAALFGDEPSAATAPAAYELGSAYQGQEGLEKVLSSLKDDRPYAMAFVDMRMPSGWDGIETIERMWQADPRLQIVICTAYTDTPWDEVLARLDVRDRLLILKKPFDAIEACQLALALTAKWQLTQDATLKMVHLEVAVQRRTVELCTANDALRLAAKVYNATTEGIMVTSPEGTILSVNDAFSRITGYTLAEVLGQNPSFMKSDRHPPEFFMAMWNTLLATGNWQGKIWDRRSDGSLLPKWLSISSVKNDAGVLTEYVGVFSDITKLEDARAKLKHQATHDSLTGLPNRSLLHDRLEQAISYADRYHRLLTVVFMDLDHFKTINDTLGHQGGDDLLKVIAGRMTGCVRSVDTVVRLGGDEFVIVLFDQPENGGSIIPTLERLRETITQPLQIGGQTLQVTASMGLATYPTDCANVSDLLTNADTAMYRAKELGRNNYQFYTAGMNTND
jgi:diguanylate cyclase (GGDEF)-like protein/PAS domain S-box-containing protein